MKKRILIISESMEPGEVGCGLLGLLDYMDYESYEVDLFLLHHKGELKGFIPWQVHRIPEIPEYALLDSSVRNIRKEGYLFLAAARWLGDIAAHRYAVKHNYSQSSVELEYSHRYTKLFLPPVRPSVEYDLAISFLAPHYLVAEKVQAKKKIAWVHKDYPAINFNAKSELKMWGKMDIIISASDAVAQSFSEVFPSLRDRVIVVKDIVPEVWIAHQSGQLDVSSEMPEDGTIRLLTVGDSANADGMPGIPELCRRIRDIGPNVKWYLAGCKDEDLIRQQIADARMEEYVIILGDKDNPYPYMRACDAYVWPDGCRENCGHVTEAKILLKPVIIIGSAASAGRPGEDADEIIVPMEPLACAEAIADVLRDEELLKRLHDNCLNRDYTNADELAKLYKIIP